MLHDRKKTFRKIFYAVKPIVPRRLQLFLRKRLIAFQIKKYEDIWPILPGSEKKPENWKGWPDGKQFALILTHDVESEAGVNQSLQLAALEKKHGFRSSFNFVPERYHTPETIFTNLKNDGFEIGVHGLYHDGKLFSSYNLFQQRAEKINYYLKKWNAVGFRAPAMHHRLDWLHLLDIQYDLSTFDTDPFEPQADGVGTIFPFVLSYKNPDKNIVEMPYTLVQDFTVFVLMNKDIQIWKQKLDWIAEHGGMALVNVHPDYLNFSERNHFERFPAKYYEEFLQYINSRYSGKFWHGLPHELARWVLKNN